MSKVRSKLLTIKEFDEITYKNNKSDRFIIIDNQDINNGKKIFEELIRFIHEFSGSENNADALELMNISYRRGIEETVKFKNYVGLVELNSGFQIEILPKILLSNEIDEEKNKVNTRKILLNLLKTVNNIDNKIFNNANLNYTQMNIYEIFINLYVKTVFNLIKKGLKSSYISKEENINTIKGKILFKEHIQYNIFHKEKVFCVFDEYQCNRAENKLIKATLQKLLKTSQNMENIKHIKQALLYFELVEISTNYEHDFSMVNLTRDMIDYKLLMEWSRVFLKNNSFSTFSGTAKSKAILFRMDKVFESYVAKMIRKHANFEWNIKTQDNKLYLFDEPIKKFKLKPDIVIEKSNGRKIILDTKWKQLNTNISDNYGISQTDMYQMFAYSKKYKTPFIWLLYPITKDMKEYSKNNSIYFKYRSENKDDEVVINVYFIDIENINESIIKLLNMIEKE